MKRLTIHTLAAGALLLSTAATASADSVTFMASSGTLSASATFDAIGSDLVITLRNDSQADVMVPADVLTAVFFAIDGPPIALTRASVGLAPGSSVLFGGSDPGGGVGGEWAYRGNLNSSLIDRSYGISSVGLGQFGPGDLFPGSNLQGPASPGGLQYGLTSMGDDPTTGNAPVTGKQALIRHAVVVTLSGLPAGFDPSSRISGVLFQYGTSLSEPRIPEPTTLTCLSAAALLARTRRTLRREGTRDLNRA